MAFVSGLVFGGSTTFLCHLTGELVRRGVQVIIVSPEAENAFASDFQAAGVKVVLQNGRLIFEDRLHSMLRTLAEFRPTVVVGCVGADSYETLRYLPKGVFRMAVIQSHDQICYDVTAPYAGFTDAIVGVSTKIVERLGQMDAFRKVAKLCLFHGVPIPPQAEPREGNVQPLRVLYLGRIVNEGKRVLVFPKILAVLQKSGIPFQWTIVGDGDRRAELERVMPSVSPAQQVMFPGAVPHAQVSALLEKHDIFLLTSEVEGLPISLLEAMAHGLVPVVSDLESGIRNVVDSSNGMLIPPDDVEGYARAIIHLHERRDELAAKSAAARARVKREFSVEAMTDRWLAAFPPKPAAVSAWPTHWDIKPPLVARHPLYFSPPMRAIRRLAAKLRR
jgi:glycosyltransferase involved in cell wall biosynthesis